jgi:hypothetical protein
MDDDALSAGFTRALRSRAGTFRVKAAKDGQPAKDKAATRRPYDQDQEHGRPNAAKSCGRQGSERGFGAPGAFGEAPLAKAATGRNKAGAAFGFSAGLRGGTGPIECRRCAKTYQVKSEIVRPLWKKRGRSGRA